LLWNWAAVETPKGNGLGALAVEPLQKRQPISWSMSAKMASHVLVDMAETSVRADCRRSPVDTERGGGA
jgi:hypothetical protein